MKATQKIILAEVKNAVKEINPKAEVILFGSRARGDAREDSDWDFLILTDDKVSLAGEDKYRDPIFLLELKFSEVLTLHFFPKNAWNHQAVTPLFENIREEGIAL